MCSNKKCKNNSPDWSFDEAIEPYKDIIEEYNRKIDQQAEIILDGEASRITFHEARWIGDGSGSVSIKDKDIIFYFDNSEVIYMTDDEVLLSAFRNIDLDIRLIKIWELILERKSIFKLPNLCNERS